MEVKRIDNGFKIFIDDKEIISHTIDNPWISIGKGKADYNMHHGNFDIKENLYEKIALSYFEIEEKELGVLITFNKGENYSIEVLFGKDNSISFPSYTLEFNRLWLRVKAEKDEHIYGCGEQFSYFDLRGKSFPLWVGEQGVGRNKSTYTTFQSDLLGKAGGDYYTTYFPQPTFVSSRKYFCHVESSAYMNFDFSKESYHELEIWDIPSKIIINSGSSYIEILGKLTELIGRQPEIPEWIYEGVWLGVQGGTDKALSKLNNVLDNGLKVSGLWIQDWEGKRITSFGKRLMWNWSWDKNLYPDLDVEIKKLREKNIRVLGYINPYLAIEGDLYREASKKGYIAKNVVGNDYLIDFGEFYAGIVDLTNKDAYEWYKTVIKKNLIEFGLGGWMADFGEYMPTDIILHNGISAEIMHNMWPVLWAKINREAIEEAGKQDDILFFMRAGYSGSQKYSTMTWAGDQNVDWSLDDGLASVIPAALSLGMSGYGLHHSDIGGYTTLFELKRTKELFMRWAEFAAFTPMMRTHEGNRPDDNWQFDSDEETLHHFARMSNTYSSLSPYLKSVVKENSENGIPAMRPLFIHYEEDEKSYDIKYEYLLGRDILVAPVYESGKDKWKVYLPEDQWVHLWTGDGYTGGEFEVDAPIGKPPVFYRKESRFLDLFKKFEE